jgi:hypothetical protein
MPSESSDTLQIQINTLLNSMDEIKSILHSMDDRIRGLENREAGCQPLITSRLDAAWRKLDDHDVQISMLMSDSQERKLTIQDLRNEFRGVKSILNWLLGITTSLLIAILIMFATGQAMLVIK